MELRSGDLLLSNQILDLKLTGTHIFFEYIKVVLRYTAVKLDPSLPNWIYWRRELDQIKVGLSTHWQASRQVDICLSIHPAIRPFIHPSTSPSKIHSHLLICLKFVLSFHPSIFSSIFPSVLPSFRPFIHQFIQKLRSATHLLKVRSITQAIPPSITPPPA